MLTCIIIIIVILIILIICGAIAVTTYNNNNQNYSVEYINGGNGILGRLKSMFSNNGGKNNAFSNSNIINNTSDIPPSLLPQNYWKHALMSQNISKMQGPKTDPNMFKYIYPLDGGSDINLGIKHCTGFGEDTVCDNFYDYITNTNNVINNNNLISGKISTAEQEMWLANRNDPSITIEKNLGSSYINTNPNADYSAYINSLVADNRMIDNHKKWVNEMIPWSGTARNVDNIEEALANSTNWLGLRRPQPIAQGPESLFITELGPTNFINNPKFNFNA
jgi:hypothetical protein